MADITKMTPDEVTAKWSQKGQASTQDYVAGVGRVSEAPGKKAGAKSEKWAKNTAAAKDRFKSQVEKVSLNDWQEKTASKGGARYAGGIAAAEDKHRRYAAFQIEYAKRLKAHLANMPDTTEAEREARMLAAFRFSKRPENKFKG